MKPNNLIYKKCVDELQFFKLWIEFLTPYHNLTARERDVAARIIAQYFKLKDNIPDPVVLKEVMWSNTSKKDMRESLGMSPAHFQMILAKLRASEVIVNGDINPRYIPHITSEPRFMLSFVFDWSSKSNPINAQQQDT